MAPREQDQRPWLLLPCPSAARWSHVPKLSPTVGYDGWRRGGREGCLLQLSLLASAIPTSQVPEQLSLWLPLPVIAAPGAVFHGDFCQLKIHSRGITKRPFHGPASLPSLLSSLFLSPSEAGVRIPSQPENMHAIPGPRCQCVAASGLLATIASSCAGCFWACHVAEPVDGGLVTKQFL